MTRKLYLFNNGGGFIRGMYDCYSITEDGHILGNHICSNSTFMQQDLHDRSDRLKVIQEHFNNEPYELIIVPDNEVTTHLGLCAAVKLHAELGDKAKEFDRAGVKAELSNGITIRIP